MTPTQTLAADRARYFRPPTTLIPPRLSDDERRLLAMVAAGLTQHQIAKRVGLNTCTVNTRLVRLYRRMGARNAPNAVAIAIRDGLISASRKGA